MQAQLLEVMIIAAYVGGIAALLVAVRLNIQYRITPEHLLITLMGFNVRKIRLDAIKGISTRRVFWAESWMNTFSSESRYMVIELDRGLLKNVVITPRYRYVFRQELMEARKTLVTLLSDPGLRDMDFHVIEPVRTYPRVRRPVLSPALSRS